MSSFLRPSSWAFVIPFFVTVGSLRVRWQSVDFKEIRMAACRVHPGCVILSAVLGSGSTPKFAEAMADAVNTARGHFGQLLTDPERSFISAV
jgi:hypothetical protein